ncbi:MAG: hypothetical protein IK005_07695 [Paludibacteraceae bacterium]|nr:hypothetical protein [Paludibacteraceae bacterium]
MMKPIHVVCALILLLFCCCAEEKKELPKKKIKKESVTPQKSDRYSKWDALTPDQRSVIRKWFDYYNDSTDDDSKMREWYDLKYSLSPEEHDAEMELNVMYYNVGNLHISESKFRKRLKEIFGYENVADMDDLYLWKRLSRNTVIVELPDDTDRYFYLSQSSRAVIDLRKMHISFSNYDDLLSYKYESDSVITNDTARFYESDLFYHRNNYLFNESASSCALLLVCDKYFMYHLVMAFGYDGDRMLNRSFLWDYMQGLPNLFDWPFSVVYFYPDGKHKIRHGLLNAVTELSSSGNSFFYLWAEEELERYVDDNQETGNRKNSHKADCFVSSYVTRLDSFISTLSFEERCEVIAHIANTIYPVFLENLDGNCEYIDFWLHSCNINVPTSFWNAINKEHNLLSEIERNNCYGLPHLQELLTVIRSDPRFYDEEGNLAPWSFELSSK